MFQASIIFDEEVKTSTGKIPFGIHTNCSVTSLEVGDNYVDINFSDSEGRVHNKRLWAPNDKYPRDGETSADALQRESRARLSHIVSLMHIFLGEDVIAKFQANTYEDFILKAVAMLNPKLKTKKVNLKLIYDADGVYSTFGNFPDYIEEYVEGVPSKLAYTTWEKKNRCTQKEQASTISKQLDDLL